MPHLPDDPRLTAYALGELDPDEAREVEATLAEDLEALALVAEVRTTARFLSESLRDEPAPGLAPSNLRAIETCLGSSPAAPAARRRRWPAYAIAAGLLGLAATLLFPGIRDALRPAPAALVLAENAPAAASPPPAIMAPALPDQFAAEGGARAVPARSPMPAESSPLAASLAPAPPDLPVLEKTGRTDDVSDRSGYLTAPGGLAPSSPSASGTGPAPAMTRAARRPRGESLGQLQKGPGQIVQGQQGQGLSPGRSEQGQGRSMQIQEGQGLAKAAKMAGAEANSIYPERVVSESAPSGVREEPGGRQVGLPQDANQFKQKAILDLKSDDVGAPDRKDFSEQTAVPVGAQAVADAFARIEDNSFRPVTAEEPSTFSVDCDTASYSSVRKFLNSGVRPPRDAVRIEELINYFTYAYPQPRGDDPLSIAVEVARCPWAAEHRLVRVGLKGREVSFDRRPPSNLVFLIDVSGSMDDLDKLPLLKAGMKLLVEALGENDRVAIVVYANSEGLALDSTSCSRKAEILSALDQLRARGGTDGGRGISLAYEVAVRNFIPGGTNRVLLATDGDFNLGVTEGAELDRLIEAKRATGVFLGVLGFGEGNVRHDRLERLADRGNGQYAFIDSINEARKVLVDQMGGTLVTVAKDVKIQVKFNPARASSYRLLGYENRLLQARDFADDRKDAGEMGAGQTVTALYEVVPPGQGSRALAALGPTQPRQSRPQVAARAASTGLELLQVDVRCKAPDGDVSRLVQCPADDDGRDFAAASPDFRFASSVAGFGMLLRDSPYKGTLTWPGLVELTAGTIGTDVAGYRGEFLELVRKARATAPR